MHGRGLEKADEVRLVVDKLQVAISVAIVGFQGFGNLGRG
jgi:hypothetical protein